MRTYMFVTADKLELPVFWSSDLQDLADLAGTTKNTLFTYISKHNTRRINGEWCYVIRVDDDDLEESMI